MLDILCLGSQRALSELHLQNQAVHLSKVLSNSTVVLDISPSFFRRTVSQCDSDIYQLYQALTADITKNHQRPKFSFFQFTTDLSST